MGQTNDKRQKKKGLTLVLLSKEGGMKQTNKNKIILAANSMIL